MIFALLPVKALAEAKNRLTGLLSAAERAQLARLMYQRTLRVLTEARGLDALVVASSDAEVLEAARAAGARVLAESEQNGHSLSADAAAARCMEWGAATLLMVPIDVPLLTAVEVEGLVSDALALSPPRLVIVPSADGTGTNALVRTPPDVIRSRFGPGSLAAHLRQAREKQLSVQVLRPEGLVFDVDTPEDLAEYLHRSPAGPIAEFLHNCGMARRLRAHLPR